MIDMKDKSQFMYWAYGAFEKGDDIEQLKILLCDYCMLDLKFANTIDIREMMVMTVTDMGIFKNEGKLQEFIREIGPEHYYKWVPSTLSQMWFPHPEYDYNKAVIYKCRSLIRLEAIRDILKDGEIVDRFEMNEPNFNLIPQRKKEDV